MLSSQTSIINMHIKNKIHNCVTHYEGYNFSLFFQLVMFFTCVYSDKALHYTILIYFIFYLMMFGIYFIMFSFIGLGFVLKVMFGFKIKLSMTVKRYIFFQFLVLYRLNGISTNILKLCTRNKKYAVINQGVRLFLALITKFK